MQQHPIFSQYRAYRGPQPVNTATDFLGVQNRLEWYAKDRWEANDDCTPALPSLDEEYFEWIDLLEAVAAASGTFTMLELGAGFGRWGLRGARAAQQLGLRTDIVFVEAEPQHAAWLREAMEINGITGRLIEAALAYDGKPVPFLVGGGGYDAVNWYGQAIMWAAESPTGREYAGKPTYRCGDYEVILAPAVTLEEVISDLPLVDFLDADLQAAELEMVQNSMAVMNERVRRVHIGTHSPEIEAALRDAFGAAGWRKVWDFAYHTTSETPYGACPFNDGVSAWINPRLS
jgi:hypothetical protein